MFASGSLKAYCNDASATKASESKPGTRLAGAGAHRTDCASCYPFILLCAYGLRADTPLVLARYAIGEDEGEVKRKKSYSPAGTYSREGPLKAVDALSTFGKGYVLLRPLEHVRGLNETILFGLCMAASAGGLRIKQSAPISAAHTATANMPSSVWFPVAAAALIVTAPGAWSALFACPWLHTAPLLSAAIALPSVCPPFRHADCPSR